MAPEDSGDRPSRPRRERPLVAPGREGSSDPGFAPPTGPPIGSYLAADDGERADHVVVEFEGPGAQRRWTVALRLILAIPLLIWAAVLFFVAFFAGIAAWFAALFTARVPEGLANFLTNILTFGAKVRGYLFLLSDRYPSFALADGEPAVRVRTNPGPLNRASVLFRVLLMIPGGIVTAIATSGAQVVAVVGWILTLILGRLPTPMFEAFAAIVRYEARFASFVFMLTAEQPKGLRGDEPAPDGAAFAPSAGGLPDLPARPRITRLVLSKAAKRLVVVILIVGVLTQIGSGINASITLGRSQAAYSDLDDAHAELGVAVGRFSAETQRCAAEASGLDCLHVADARFAEAWQRFADDVRDISFPLNIDADALIRDAEECASLMRMLAAASTPTEYQRVFDEFRAAATQFDADYRDVAVDL